MNSFQWYQKRVYKLNQDYDETDYEKAFHRA
ncbi:MAG: 2-oxoacid ferredoxin oxidoreductase, partial [Pseudomonadota bacterium]